MGDGPGAPGILFFFNVYLFCQNMPIPFCTCTLMPGWGFIQPSYMLRTPLGLGHRHPLRRCVHRRRAFPRPVAGWGVCGEPGMVLGSRHCCCPQALAFTQGRARLQLFAGFSFRPCGCSFGVVARLMFSLKISLHVLYTHLWQVALVHTKMRCFASPWCLTRCPSRGTSQGG